MRSPVSSPQSFLHPSSSNLFLSGLPSIFIWILLLFSSSKACYGFEIREANIEQIQLAFRQNKLTSRELVEFYLRAIRELNPLLQAVIEVNPDALHQADKADQERKNHCRGALHGIPVLLKDNIATKDRLNTTAGSLALLGSVVPKDAGVVRRLRNAGAIILGKAGMNEWANFRSDSAPDGWSARGGQPKNPYVLSADPCGSSTGSAVAVAANMVTVSLGTETDGSIICPSSVNGVVGIKPTVGLTSRAGVIPVSPRQDTVGPICRSVLDAVYVLDEIVGFDTRDDEATRKATKFIPAGGYKQFLKVDGLRGKRLGIVRNPFFNLSSGSFMKRVFEKHLTTLRQGGATIVDNLEISNVSVVLDFFASGELVALLHEFKISLNAYLPELIYSPVRSLSDVIAFNKEHPIKERMEEIGQAIFLAAENTTSPSEEERRAVHSLRRLSRHGYEKLMKENDLDALVTPDTSSAPVLAIGGYPGIIVPAGYGRDGVPFGICFGGLRGSESKLIEIAFAFEQATKIRNPPSFI